jgi:hypothetical protein
MSQFAGQKMSPAGVEEIKKIGTTREFTNAERAQLGQWVKDGAISQEDAFQTPQRQVPRSC